MRPHGRPVGGKDTAKEGVTACLGGDPPDCLGQRGRDSLPAILGIHERVVDVDRAGTDMEHGIQKGDLGRAGGHPARANNTIITDARNAPLPAAEPTPGKNRILLGPQRQIPLHAGFEDFHYH